MKSVHIVLNGRSELYAYRCTGCGREFATWPVYYPGKRVCKFCPDCGHQFKDPDMYKPDEIEQKIEKKTTRSSISPYGGSYGR